MTNPVPSGRVVVERARTATGEWQLQRRGEHYELIANGTFLMATYNRASDEALARLALARVAGKDPGADARGSAADLRVLVGGLGIGYTVRAALDDPRVGRVDVVEIEPLIVTWYRRYTAPHAGRPLDDPRVHLIVGDLGRIDLPERAYGAILLDTDNGPDWLALERNAGLYGAAGAARFLGLLRPGGLLAYWSASESPAFLSRLRAVADVEVIEVPDEIAPGRTASAYLYLARPAGGNPSLRSG